MLFSPNIFVIYLFSTALQSLLDFFLLPKDSVLMYKVPGGFVFVSFFFYNTCVFALLVGGFPSSL